MKLIHHSLLCLLLSIVTNSSFAKPTETEKTNPIKVETIGKGKAVFYLPGFTAPGSIWKETLENINLNRKSYLVSYAGFNGNKPIKMPWYKSIKASIVAYMKENNLSDIIIIGHSMGGNLALDIAYELPDKVSKIVLVESLPCIREIMMPNVPAANLFYDSPYNKKMLDMNKKHFENVATMMATNMTLNKDKVKVLKNWILEADRETWVYGYTDLLKLDLRNILNQVKCEVLILGTSFPNLETAKKNYESQYSNLPNKTIVMASNSKHFIMFDQPKWLYKIINDFLVDEKKQD